MAAGPDLYYTNGAMDGTLAATFGISGDELALADHRDPNTPDTRSYTTAVNSPGNEPAFTAIGAMLDPHGSALFWVAVAAVLGLIIVSGQVRFEAAAGGRVGRRG